LAGKGLADHLVWIALDPSTAATAPSSSSRVRTAGRQLSADALPEGHEIKFTDSDLVPIPDIDADRTSTHQMVENGARRLPGVPRHDRPRRAGNDTPGARRRGLSLRYTRRRALRPGPAHSSFRTSPTLQPARR